MNAQETTKKHTIISHEKGKPENVTFSAVVTDWPTTKDSFLEACGIKVAEFTNADFSDQLYRNAELALEGKVKQNFETGEEVTFKEVLENVGKKTQKGLDESIAKLITTVAVSGLPIVATVVPALVNLQAVVKSDYKGKSKEHYASYRKLYQDFTEAKAAAEEQAAEEKPAKK